MTRKRLLLLVLAAVLASPAKAQIRFAAPAPLAPSLGVPEASLAPLGAPAGGPIAPGSPEALPDGAPLPAAVPLSLPEGQLPDSISPESEAPAAFSAKEAPADARSAPAAEGRDRLGEFFDGSQFRALTAEPALPVEAGNDGAAALSKAEDREEQPLELRFLNAHSKSILKSERTTSIRLVRDTEGSRRYWAKFKRGQTVSVLAGGQLLMKTQVTRGVTKKISQLSKDDLAGMFSPTELNVLGVRDLRKAVLANLNSFRGAGSIEAPVGLDSRVRVIQFKSFAQIHKDHLPPEPVQKGPRAPLKIADGSPLRQLNEIMPRVVMIDLDLYKEAVPSETLEDMSKLMRTGVTFVGLSRRSTEDASKTLMKNMSSFQRDVLLPYRFMMMSENGAVVSSFVKGGRARAVEDAGFDELELESVRAAVRQALSSVHKSSRSLREGSASRGIQELRLSAGVDGQAFTAALQKELGLLGRDFKVRLSVEGSDSIVRIYKTTLAASMNRLSSAIDHDMSVFALPGDTLVLSDDASLAAALPGSPDLLKKAPELKGEEIVDNTLGAILGEYRENRDGDLSGSASRLGSFLKHHAEYLDQYVLAQEESYRNIHFFSGHMVHKALDWAVWRIRQGKQPSEAEVVAKLHEFWEAEDRGGDKPVAMPPGHTMTGMLEASKARTMQLYKHVTDVTAQGYQLVGTEIPNFFTLRSYEKNGELRRRYFLHTIFDLVAMKPTGPNTAELVILDFKSGPSQTMQKLEQDLQVLMYSLFLRNKWQTMTMPYSTVGGKTYKIEKSRVEFLYSPVRLPPNVTNWDLAKVEKKIIRTMDRMQAEREKAADPAGQKAMKKILKRAKALKKAMGR